MTTLFYSKISRVSRVQAITDTGTGDEKRIGEVPTIHIILQICQKDFSPLGTTWVV